MMAIMASRGIFLRSQALDMQVWRPALERARPVLDAADDIVAVE